MAVYEWVCDQCTYHVTKRMSIKEYKPKEMKNKEVIKTRKKYIEGGMVALMILSIVYFYKQ